MSSLALLEESRIGRPRKYQDIDSFEQAIDAYFQMCDEQKRPYTVTGLAVALETNRQTLLNYQGVNPDRPEFASPRFVDAIKRAKARVENSVEEAMLTRDRQVTGHIFSLKNNFGWQDTQQIAHLHAHVGVGAAPPSFEVVEGQIAQIASENADRPALGTEVSAPTFASEASLSPVPRCDYPVEKQAK